MQTSGIKKQWSKLQALVTVLPKNIIEEIKPLLRRKESEWTDKDSYLQVKTEMLRIFSPKDYKCFEKAMTRVLSDTPSALARALVNDLCDKQLAGCCCHRFIVGLWKRSLPMNVRQAISGMPFTKENFDNITQHADQVYEEGRPRQTIAAISRETTFISPHEPSIHDTAFSEGVSEGAVAAGVVAAYNYQRGRGSGGPPRGGRGGGRGNGRGGGRGNRGGGNNNGGGNSGSGQGQKKDSPPPQDGQACRLAPVRILFPALDPWEIGTLLYGTRNLPLETVLGT